MAMAWFGEMHFEAEVTPPLGHSCGHWGSGLRPWASARGSPQCCFELLPGTCSVTAFGLPGGLCASSGFN